MFKRASAFILAICLLAGQAAAQVVSATGGGSAFAAGSPFACGTAGSIIYSDGTNAQCAGAVKATSLAINGATIGSYNFALTGTASFSSTVDLPQAASNTTNGTNAILSFGGTRGTNNLYISAFNNKIYFGGQGQNNLGVSSAGFQLPSGAQINWQNSLTSVDATADLILTRAAAATLQHGAADAAAPVAQTIGFQGSRSGTDSNVGGANATIRASLGTGTGTPANLILSGAVGAASGTGAHTASAAVTIAGAVNGQVPSVVIGSAAISTSATDGFLYIPTSAGTPTGTPTTFTGRVAIVYDTTNHQFWIYDSGWKQPKTPAAAALVTWQ